MKVYLLNSLIELVWCIGTTSFPSGTQHSCIQYLHIGVNGVYFLLIITLGPVCHRLNGPSTSLSFKDVLGVIITSSSLVEVTDIFAMVGEMFSLTVKRHMLVFLASLFLVALSALNMALWASLLALASFWRSVTCELPTTFKNLNPLGYKYTSRII